MCEKGMYNILILLIDKIDLRILIVVSILFLIPNILFIMLFTCYIDRCIIKSSFIINNHKYIYDEER